MLRELFTNNDLLSEALLNIEDKKISPGIDGVRVEEFDNFLKLNWDNIVDDIVAGKYFPKLVIEEEILSKKGKKRKIYKYCLIDVYIQKILSIFLHEYFTDMFSGNLYSFQKGIGILDLLKEATKSIENGKEYVVEVDIKNYFENINHDVLEKQLLSIFQDKNFVDLIMIFHKCSIIKDGLTRKNKKGLITGSSLGPI